MEVSPLRQETREISQPIPKAETAASKMSKKLEAAKASTNKIVSSMFRIENLPHVLSLWVLHEVAVSLLLLSSW